MINYKARKFASCKVLLPLCFPLIATTIATTAQAMTLSSSEAEFQINNFSAEALDTVVDAFTVSLVRDNDIAGIVESEAVADAFFSIIDSSTLSETRSVASGDGDSFFSLATSDTAILGTFEVEDDETFSFDFDGFLDLATTNELPENENAIAAASISLVLIDSTTASEPNVFSFFDVFAQLDTVGGDDVLVAPSIGENFVLNNLNTISSIGIRDRNEFINTQFSGSFTTSFSSPTSLTLVQVQNSFALVETTPESDSLLGILALSTLALGYKRQRQSS